MSRYHNASRRIAGGTPARTHKGFDVLVDISDTSDYGEEGFFLVEVFEPGTGESIGQLDVAGDSGHSDVKPEYQRRGVATLMYNLAEEKLGYSLRPSAELTDAGEAFWESWSPESLDDQ